MLTKTAAAPLRKTPCKRKMAVWRRPGFLRQSNPGVPSDVMVYLRVLARTGRVDFKRPFASFPPSSGSTTMSMLCVARRRSARVMIECMCTQKRWNPEVAIIFCSAARYRRATVGSSHDDAHPDNSALHTGAVCPQTGFVESFFFISPRTGHGISQIVRNAASFFVYFVGAHFSCGG